ncbi:hypothetical protein GCK72_015278 [Caenorhabditis remanei]|nr:hypothetical protein GCK72_015278 [Caenorhabditis remanei]KAF1758818.1 hypothetical protein GCK72_015278 [Caenorhabditis remanei]
MIFDQLLISSLLFGTLVMAEYEGHYNNWTAEEKNNANTLIWILIVVGVLISISGIAGGAFFYMMRKRNSMNNQGQVMVVH